MFGYGGFICAQPQGFAVGHPAFGIGHPVLAMGHPGLAMGHPAFGGGVVMMGMGGGGAHVLVHPALAGRVAAVCRECGHPMMRRGDGSLECTGCDRVVDNGAPSVSRGLSTRSSRSERLRSGDTVTGYHQTDCETAKIILSEQRFLRGSSGAAGGGIYFAVCASDTHRKAHKHGTILCADVKLGRCKRVSSPDSSISFQSLDAEGYDSVRLTAFQGDELVVYNYDQVSNIREVRG